MDKLLNFLLDYYLWILGVLVIIIITIIGFLVDSKQKRKKKESSIKATDVGEVKTVTEVETPKEEVKKEEVVTDNNNAINNNLNTTNNVMQESINNVSDNVNTNSDGVNKVIENSTSSKNLDLLSNQTPHFEPREVNIPSVNKNMEVNNGLNAVTNANTSNATIVQAQQSINPISSNNVNASGMYYNNASMPVQEVKNYNEPEVINSTSNYGQNVYQGVNMVPNNNMIYTNNVIPNATLREVVPQPVQAVPINNAYNGQMGFQNNRVNNQMYTNYNSNANYTTPIPNNTNVNYTAPIGEVPNNNYAKVIPNTVNNNNVSNNMNNNVNNSQVSAYPNMSFVTGDKNDDTWKL